MALAYRDRSGRPTATEKTRLSRALPRFADQVDELQADEEAEVSGEAQRYLRSLSRGANDKARRGERHQALLEFLAP